MPEDETEVNDLTVIGIPADYKPTTEQSNLLQALQAWTKTSVKAANLQGKAGSGKSSTLMYFINTDWNGPVVIIAPTHAALVQLRQRIEPSDRVSFLTVAKALSSFPVVSNTRVETGFASFGGKPFDEEALILVDESSMLSSSEVVQLISLSTKIIFSGDTNQLAPVKKKSGYEELAKLEQFTLETMMRADSQELISIGLKALEQTQFIPDSTSDNAVVNHETEADFEAEFLKQVVTRLAGDCVWITRTNEEVRRINAQAHYAVTSRNTLEPGDTIRLYATSKLGYNNTLAVVKTVEKAGQYGTLLITTEPEDGTEYKVEVALPEAYDRIKKRIEGVVKLFQDGAGNEAYEKELKMLRSIVEIDYPYAITTHKSQGASIPVVFANTLKLHGRKSFYVAYSRAAEQLHVIKKSFKKGQCAINSVWFNPKLNITIQAPYQNVAEVRAEIEAIVGKDLTPSVSHLACTINPNHSSKSAKGWKLVEVL